MIQRKLVKMNPEKWYFITCTFFFLLLSSSKFLWIRRNVLIVLNTMFPTNQRNFVLTVLTVLNFSGFGHFSLDLVIFSRLLFGFSLHLEIFSGSNFLWIWQFSLDYPWFSLDLAIFSGLKRDFLWVCVNFSGFEGGFLWIWVLELIFQ